MASENIKVAVRLRPFNSREKERNATLVVKMEGSETVITDPQNSENVHKFTFDHSYWSHDGFKEEDDGYFSPDPDHPHYTKYADQVGKKFHFFLLQMPTMPPVIPIYIVGNGEKKIFDDLGAGLLHNAWQGYNSTLFAYGQTGSGKSWSIVGYGENKGIVPQFCEKLFQDIEQKKEDAENGTDFQVICSMLELYNEKIWDLLSPRKSESLKICLHPSHGFYVKNLQQIPVKNFEKIKELMDVGTTNRTVAATNMNATSSRAHTMFGITFTQKFKNSTGTMSEKSALINLVDLAGSERAASTGATGSRLKEGAAINKSLFTLGNCIAALAKQASGANIKVPYMDSMLTKLLKNALGGNSKTIMVAAVSPADINYQESLSTLRYVNRAKEIKTMARINESETDVIIRKLTEEIEQYKNMIKSGNIPMMAESGDLSEDDKINLRKEIEEEYSSILDENNRRIEEIRMTYAERIKEAETTNESAVKLRKTMELKKKSVAHIYNLNMDPQLTGHVIYFLEDPPITVGKSETNRICLKGPSIEEYHTVINQVKGEWVISLVDHDARLLINGVQVSNKKVLHHNDRIVFGTTQYYVMTNPSDKRKKNSRTITFDMAQKEITVNSGIDSSLLVEEDLLEMVPAIDEVNAISKELEAKKRFSLMLNKKSEIQVLVTDIETDIKWIWTKQEFLSRKFVMQELYQQFITGQDWKLPQDQDPFYDDPSAPFLIGSVDIFLKSLAHGIDTKQIADILDYRALKAGTLEVHLIPCNKNGEELVDDGDSFYCEPEERLNKDLHIKIVIVAAHGLPSIFTDTYCTFTMYLDNAVHKTQSIAGTMNPKWDFSKLFSFPLVTEQLIEYLGTGTLNIDVWGRHRSLEKGKSLMKEKVVNVESNIQKMQHIVELSILQKKHMKLEKKMKNIRLMIDTADRNKRKTLPVKLVRRILESNDQVEIDKILLQITNVTEENFLEENSSNSTNSPKTDKEIRQNPRKMSLLSDKPEKNSRLCKLI